MPRHIYILRWIAVLPGALLAAFLILFPVRWAIGLIQLGEWFDHDESILFLFLTPENMERLGDAFCVPFGLIMGGARIAPNYKLHTGITMAVLWMGLFGYLMFWVIREGGFQVVWLDTILGLFAGMGGAAVALHQVKNSMVPATISAGQP